MDEPRNYGWDRSHFCFRGWGKSFGIGTLSFATVLGDLSAAHNGWPSTRTGRSPRAASRLDELQSCWRV